MTAAAARTVAAAPVPLRARVLRLPAGAAGLRLVECAVGLLAVGLALGMFGGFYDGVSWLPWLVGTAVLTGAVVGFALLRGARWWTATVVVVLVLGCAHTAGYRQLGWHGLPTVESLRGLAAGLTSGLPKMLAVGLPANAGGDLVVLPLLLAGAAGAGTVALLLRTRWVTPVVLPTVAVFLAGLALTASRGGSRLVLTGALVLVVLGLLVLRSNRVSVAEGEGIKESDADAVGLDLAARRRRSTYGRVVLGLPVVVLVTLGAVLAALLLPVPHGTDRVDPRSLYQAPFQTDAVLSPLAELRPQLVGADEPLFTVRVQGNDPRSALDRVRIAALDRFDGGLWTRARTFQVTGTTLPDPEPLPAEAGQVRLDVRIERLSQPFLPVTGDPLRFTGSDFAFDRATGTVVSTRENVAGVGYSTTAAERRLDQSALTVEPSRTRQDAAYRELPRKPPWVADVLGQPALQNRNTLGELFAIETYLKAQVFQRSAPPGNSYGVVYRVLFGPEPRYGSAEQYAAAFAILARAAGIPSRVAVGYLLRPEKNHGGTYQVSTHDAHAWPEVHLQGYGWVPFEPTNLQGELSAPPARDPDLTLEAADAARPPPAAGGAASGGVPQPQPSVADRVLPIAATVAGGIAAVVVLVLLLKSARRLRRARRGPPAQRIVGAWRQVVDRLREAGVRVPSSQTGSEVARDLLGGSAAPVSRHVAELAPLVAGALFAYDEPDEADAARAWTLERRIRRELAAALPLGTRIRGALDPRPLLPRLGRRQRPARSRETRGRGRAAVTR